MKAFRRLCHAAAHTTSGRLIEFRIAEEPTPNFHQALISYADQTVAVVCLRDAPVLALAVPRVIGAAAEESGPLTFVEHRDLAAALAAAPDFRLLTPAELAGPIDWPQIAPSDLRYWNPGNLGEALFNYWD